MNRECPFCGGDYKPIEAHSKDCHFRMLSDNFKAFYLNDRTYHHSAEEMEKAWNIRYEQKGK